MEKYRLRRAQITCPRENLLKDGMALSSRIIIGRRGQREDGIRRQIYIEFRAPKTNHTNEYRVAVMIYVASGEPNARDLI